MIHIWRPWKLSNFQDSPPPLSIPTLSIFVQNSSTPFTLDVLFQTNPPSFLLSLNDNQSIKENMFQRWLLYVIRLYILLYVILSGFPLTSFHLAEASLSDLLWLYTLVCAVVQKYHEMSFKWLERYSNPQPLCIECGFTLKRVRDMTRTYSH